MKMANCSLKVFFSRNKGLNTQVIVVFEFAQSCVIYITYII